MKAVTQHKLYVREGRVFLQSFVAFGGKAWNTETEIKVAHSPYDLRRLMQLHCGKLSNCVGNSIVGKA